MKILSALKAERNVSQLLAEPDSNTPTAQKALASLKNSGAGAIPVLIDALASADRYQTIGIVDALTSLVNDRTYKLFVEGLKHPNERCVAGVAWALSEARSYTFDNLTKTLEQEDVATHAILDAMRSHVDQLNVRLLLGTAYKVEPREKKALFKMIGSRATDDLVPELVSRTGGRDHAARVHIIGILAKFPLNKDVQVTLETLLKDEQRQVRAAAVAAIGQMELPQNIELLVAGLLDGDLEVQSKTVDLLVQLRHPDTCKYLATVLSDESEYTRRSAVEVLNEVADPSSIKYLLQVLGDGDWWVRSRACDALAKIGGPKVLSAVMQLIRDKDENIRRAAIEILNQTKDEAAVKHLLQATEDDDWWVSERAVDALGEIGDALAVPRLLKMLNGGPKSVPSVARALGKIGDKEVVPQLLGLLQRPETNIITETISALAKLVDETNTARIRSAIQPMLTVANDDVVTTATKAMEHINTLFPPAQKASEAAGSAAQSGTMQIGDSDMRKIAAGDNQRAMVSSESQIDLAALATGDLIEDRYKYIEKIGKGAFGTVILVEDTVVDERLILKFLNPNVSTDEEMLQRFVHELRFSRKITHRNVIRIYDFLKLSGSYAISMEYFPSHTLGGEIVDSTPLNFDKAAGWAIDIATGMGVAHQVGVVHRDLKPANLLINDAGLLKIVDFGVAAAAGGGDTQLTKTGYVIGSPKYMAPEQILGKEIDNRADIYSLGIIFYEMLTGAPPYTKGDHMAVMYQHVQGKCARCNEVNPEIPQELADVVHKAMAINKADRYQSMADFRTAIETTMATQV